MAYSKADYFLNEDIEMALLAKALSHPARLSILKIIASNKDCICGEIVSELPLSQSTISQHLKELKSVGLIKGEIDGPRVCYCIDQERMKIARDFFCNLFKIDMKCCSDNKCNF